MFIDNCAACHGRGATGNHALGAPDLTDGDWLHGGDGNAILASITGRRMARCRPSPAPFPKTDVDSRITSQAVGRDPRRPPRGTRQARCSRTAPPATAPTARATPRSGHRTLPTPPGSTAAHRDIAETIRDGRDGEMPAWRARLTKRTRARRRLGLCAIAPRRHAKSARRATRRLVPTARGVARRSDSRRVDRGCVRPSCWRPSWDTPVATSGGDMLRMPLRDLRTAIGPSRDEPEQEGCWHCGEPLPKDAPQAT